ncbi:hypothetical protein [Nostoc sp.]|uniref:hypothetical protein n=1 Tax=Nostoc sp. TaxID=1180 RepID=UPI002FFA5987
MLFLNPSWIHEPVAIAVFDQLRSLQYQMIKHQPLRKEGKISNSRAYPRIIQHLVKNPSHHDNCLENNING